MRHAVVGGRDALRALEHAIEAAAVGKSCLAGNSVDGALVALVLVEQPHCLDNAILVDIGLEIHLPASAYHHRHLACTTAKSLSYVGHREFSNDVIIFSGKLSNLISNQFTPGLYGLKFGVQKNF